MEKVNELIRTHFKGLTNGQKLVAEYIINNPRQIVFCTAKEIGELSKTSETTVIRFCYKVGYTGYSQLQKAVQMSLIEANEDPIVKYREEINALEGRDNMVKRVMEQDIAFIEETLGNLSDKLYEKVITHLVEAKKRFVVGFRSSYGPASWFAFSLNIVRGDTFQYRGAIDDSTFHLSLMDEDSMVIAMSFPRYVQETLSFVSAAKKRGARILVITDNELAPLSEYADLLISIKAPTPIGLKGMPTIFSVLNVLISGVAYSRKEEVRHHISHYEETRRELFPIDKKKNKSYKEDGLKK